MKHLQDSADVNKETQLSIVDYSDDSKVPKKIEPVVKVRRVEMTKELFKFSLARSPKFTFPDTNERHGIGPTDFKENQEKTYTNVSHRWVE